MVGIYLRAQLLLLVATLCIAAQTAAAQEKVGFWNGFSNHTVIAECINATDRDLTVLLEARNNDSAVIGQDAFSFAPKASHHTVLNQFSVQDRYGTFTVRPTDGSPLPDGVVCVAMHYRMLPQGSEKAVEYAFSVPMLQASSEPVSGIFNSYNAGGGSLATWNWLSVVNLGTAPLAAFVEVYKQDGTLDPERSFSVSGLAPGARSDYALGHPYGQMTGLYRVVPADSNQRFAAFLSRYGRSDQNRFIYAFATIPKVPSCDPGPVPASTMDPAINWGEVANPTPHILTVQLEVRDAWGNIQRSQQLQISPFSQQHFYLNDSIGPRSLGTFYVRCSPGNPTGAGLLVQSAYYGYRAPNKAYITWAYVSQADGDRGEEGDSMIVPANTFLRTANWVKAYERAGRGAQVDFGFHDTQGKTVGRTAYSLGIRAGVDVGAHEKLGYDAVGAVSFVPNFEDVGVGGELLRVFPSTIDRIGYIANIPARRVQTDPARKGAIHASADRHSLKFRGKKVLLLGDSVTQGWMELGTDFNHAAYLDELQRRGANAFMIWSYIAILNQTADARIGYEAPEIWPWRELSGAQNPPFRFQFIDGAGNAIFNDFYFARLRELVALAAARDIVVIITVHDGWTKQRFAGHPFNTANGGSISAKEQYVQLADYSREMGTKLDAGATALQKHQFLLERFTDRLITATADYNNVAFEVLNEGEWYNVNYSRPFNEHFAKFIKARTSRPVIVNDDHVGGQDFWGESSVDLISLHQPNWDSGTHVSKAFLHFEPRYYNDGGDLAKPLIFSEPVPEYLGNPNDRDGLMRLMWGTLLAGTGYMMPNDSRWKWQPANIDPIFDIVGNAAKFLNQMGIDLEDLEPNVELSSSKVVLAKPGVRYLIYSQTTASTLVDLVGSTGNFLVRFYNPRTGQFHPQTVTVPGGDPDTLINKPSDSDWVLWLERQ